MDEDWRAYFAGGPLRSLMPFIAWPVYVVFAEGGHFTPIGGKLWSGASVVEKLKGFISGILAIACVYGFVQFCDFDFYTFGIVYLGPWFFFSWWLFTVTFLQHHHESSVVYSTETWSYAKFVAMIVICMV